VDLVSLLARCRDGDTSAWNEFDEWFEGKSRRILAGYRLTSAQADDVRGRCRLNITQAIQRGAIRGQSSGEIASYVATALKRAALDVRAERPRDEVSDDLPDPAPQPDDVAFTLLELEKVETLMMSWPLEDRVLFVAKVHGVSATTIQADLERNFGVHIAVATVDSRFSKLRAELRKACGRTED
jgi:DNA-directed RNA polymerase specialized sigma24 family protein